MRDEVVRFDSETEELECPPDEAGINDAVRQSMQDAYLWLAKYGMHRPFCPTLETETDCTCGYTSMMVELHKQILDSGNGN